MLRHHHPEVTRTGPEVVLGLVPPAAWEQRRAAASGLSAVEVVERVVEMPAPAQAPPKARNQEWHAPLRELTRQIQRGLVYDRYLIGIADEVRQV